MAVHDRDYDPHEDPAVASPAVRERLPWRSAVGGAASLGTPVGIGLLTPLLGEPIFGIEIVVALTVIAVALFGSQTPQRTRVRLLRWFGKPSRAASPEPGDNPLYHPVQLRRCSYGGPTAACGPIR